MNLSLYSTHSALSVHYHQSRTVGRVYLSVGEIALGINGAKVSL